MKARLVALALLTTAVGTAPAVAQVDSCPGDMAGPATRATVEYVSGGRTIRALHYVPGRPNGRALVLLHGAGGLRQDAPVFDPHLLQLAARGWHVLAPAYYEALDPPERRTSRDLRVWRRVAHDGAGWLRRRPGMEAGRVAVMGYSLGGFLAVEAAMEEPVWSAGIAVAAGLDVGEPLRDRRGTPLLLIHAERDPVISPVSTRQWAGGLERRGAAVRVHELVWSGHFFDRATWCGIFSETTAFLDAAMPDAAP